MAIEDFTDAAWIEVDNGSDLTVTSTKADWVTMDRNVDDYLYKDYTAGHFSGDFEFDFEHELTAISGAQAHFLVSITNSIGDMGGNVHSLDVLIDTASYTPKIADIDDTGTADMLQSGTNLTTGTLYYSTFKRVGNTLTLDIYTNSIRTALDQSISGTIVNTGYTYRYLYAMSSYNSGGSSQTSTGYMQNLDINEAADTNVLATTDALTLTENAATVNAETNVLAAVDSLTLTELQATVSITADTNVLASTDALTLTEYLASINAATDVQTNTDALTLTTYQSTVSLVSGTNVLATTDVLTLTEQQAGINAAINILASTDSLVLTGLQASIGVDVGVQIDGSGSYIINTNYGSATMYFNGENYYTI